MSRDLLIAILFGLAALGILLAVAGPALSGSRAAKKRRAMLVQSSGAKRVNSQRAIDTAQRRKQIAESLKEIENRGKKANALTLDQRIAQSGLRITRPQFFIWSAVLGLVFGLMLFLFTGDPMMFGAGLLTGGFGLPRWVLSYLRKRRLTKFSVQFPDAIDVIIRGVKAGLPLIDSLRVVANESAEPIKSEFVQIIEAQTVGLSITESVERISERVPVAEARFFAILIGIQQKSGGSLAEGLGNLSRVLRERKKLAQKIKAMSAEAKASAGIIGALPFVVASLVYLTSPGYMDLLWTTTEGRVMLAISAIWMSLGVFTMKKMISFDY